MIIWYLLAACGSSTSEPGPPPPLFAAFGRPCDGDSDCGYEDTGGSSRQLSCRDGVCRRACSAYTASGDAGNSCPAVPGTSCQFYCDGESCVVERLSCW